MLDQQKGDFFFQCDDCGEVLETKTSNFDAARNVLKREGWRAIKVGEAWEHRCPQCSEG
jgi:Fe2+ or Zn2+ uptake regulation protein